MVALGWNGSDGITEFVFKSNPEKKKRTTMKMKSMNKTKVQMG